MENAASLASGPDGRKRRVSYIYEPGIGEGNQRVSQQISTTHNLIRSYQLHNDMDIIRPTLAKDSDLIQFHSPEYISFLRSVTPEYIDDMQAYKSENVDDTSTLQLFNLDESDTPLFPGLIDYCRLYAGGSISAASKLNGNEADIAINWSGGMHRAKRDEACDFGYVNDVVLGILELLNVFKRVLYIDIGYFHGDAVQEAFDKTDRVMTISFHMHGAQRSGYITDYGVGKGEYYSLNAPLKYGMDDKTLVNLLVPVVHKAMEVYQPEAIVLQCGPDSLADDVLGEFNLTAKGPGTCLSYIRSFNVPLMLLGGPGHNLGNVARCWCYETAVAVGKEIDEDLDNTVSDACFHPDYQLRIEPGFMENLNTREYIANIKRTLLNQLSQVIHAPSVQFQDTPPISQVTEEAEEDMETR
ncbi:Histone deacetylase 7 [Raphanus sativus]|uniref:Histone deacetylase n=1 Tax=Raphanus sativus TaxID=3726 RepID=A0A6J0KQW8_RAPSA|nr:histone deacetylase 7 [Raphanus sativus]KAJ4880857.1 Histone deacetylase 7 [Raphanus sativus]